MAAGAPSLGPLTRFMPDLAFGVALFFTLSGFLLYRPFVAALLAGERRPRVRSYLRNRALRILPAYWVILLATAVVLQSAIVWKPDGSLGTSGLGAGELVRHALLLQHYDPDTVTTGIGPAWSLAVEVVFYLVLPVLALGAFALARRADRYGRRVAAALAPAVLLLLLGLGGKAASAYLVPPVSPFNGWEADWHSVLERSFLTHADLFAFGMAVAVLRVVFDVRGASLSRAGTAVAFGFAAGAYLVTAKMTTVHEQMSYSPYNTLIAAGCAALLILVVLPARSGRTPLLVRLLETRALVTAGLVSYSVFLWHHPLVLWLNELELTRSGAGGFVFDLIVVGTLTLVLSLLTYRFVEYPALRRKQASRRPPVPAAAPTYEAAP